MPKYFAQYHLPGCLYTPNIGSAFLTGIKKKVKIPAKKRAPIVYKISVTTIFDIPFATDMIRPKEMPNFAGDY